jgi:hypothetical protein
MTRAPAPAAVALVGFHVHPVPASAVLAVCRHCGMAITRAELDPATGVPFALAGQPFHAECAAFVAARHQPLEQSNHG